MRPPVVAEALVAALAPPNDYESIAGDLHEEYLRCARLSGRRAANRWYWSQVLRSIPWLLSYSRVRRSALRAIRVGLTALGVLIAMILATIPINALLDAIFGRANWPGAVSFCAYWTDGVVFGAFLALLVRSGGVRLAFGAASFLVLAFAVPALLGFPSSQAPLPAWVLLGGMIPAMCAGAGLYQVAHTKRLT
ncbi:MAG TPA: permease prefix domain 2-containing transporter [Candidatus Cybelea sp.]